MTAPVEKREEQKQETAKLAELFHPSFRFVVDVDNVRQAAFMECTLPTIEWEQEEVKEGGLNTYVHVLPGRRKSGTLSLKNGVAKSDLLLWYIRALEGGGIAARKSVTVTLLDSHLRPVISWHVRDAFPVKWSAPQLKPDDNTIAVQTLELACGPISVSPESPGK